MARLVSVLLLLCSLTTPGGMLAQHSSTKGSTLSDANTGQVYRVGKDIAPPKPIYTPQPQYTKAARKAKLNGTVVVQTIVSEDGHTRDTHILRGLDKGLDENAVAAIQTWTFQPATKDGKPVAVQINVEVTFRLY